MGGAGVEEPADLVTVAQNDEVDPDADVERLFANRMRRDDHRARVRSCSVDASSPRDEVPA